MRTKGMREIVGLAAAVLALIIAPACQRSHEHPEGEEHPTEHAEGAEHPEGHEHPEGEEHPAEHPGPVAVAELKALGGSGVKGRVVLTAVDGGVKVEADVTGLSPGQHGFHVHEWGDCSATDGKSAGGHFNPGGHPHAGPTDPEAHAGDLGNITADQNGHASLEMTTNKLALGTDVGNGVVGRSIIVHEKADDLVSQPTGAAGGRLACGVITLEGGDTRPVLAP